MVTTTIYCQFSAYYWSAHCNLRGRVFGSTSRRHGSARQATDEVIGIITAELSLWDVIALHRVSSKCYEISIVDGDDRTGTSTQMAANVRPRPILREAGKTYVMMREGDPWHACHVTWLAHTRPYPINGVLYVDCYLPKRWRKIATDRQTDTRPIQLSELW